VPDPPDAPPHAPHGDTPPAPKCDLPLLVDLTVQAVRGDFEGLEALRRAHPELACERGREALLQVHLFAGFPRIVEAFQVLATAGGMGRPEGEEVRLEEPQHTRGRALFERIYGDGAARVEGLLAELHPDLCDWVLGHAYGRVLTRPGLSARERELLAVAALAASRQDRQLASHVRGAVACGASRADLEQCLERAARFVEAADVERARRVVERFA
jgi:4-carboxymuconolactone decarboxylase